MTIENQRAEVERLEAEIQRQGHILTEKLLKVACWKDRAERAEAELATIYAEGLVPVLEARAERAEAALTKLDKQLTDQALLFQRVVRAEAEVGRLREIERVRVGELQRQAALADQLAEALRDVLESEYSDDDDHWLWHPAGPVLADYDKVRGPQPSP